MTRLFHRHGRADAPRGQALVEFSLVVFPLLLIVMGIMQFGLLFWGQITLTQIGRDTGRWAATQPACDSSVNLSAEANAIAAQSLLVGYSGSNPVALSNAAWTPGSSPTTSCPPPDNTEVWYVSFDLTYQAPVFVPLIPVDGVLSTEVRYRIEPAP